MPYLLFLKKQQNLKFPSAANDRWRFMGYFFLVFFMISGLLTELIEMVFTERKGKSVGSDLISPLTSVLDGLVLGN